VKFSRKQKVLLVSLAIFLLSFLFRLWGIKETGGTWDEDIYYNSAYHYYFNLKNLDFSRASWGWNFEHPPVAKYIYLPGAWLSQKLPADPAFRTGVNYLPLRVESALMGALTCVLVFLIGLQVFGSFWTGLFAGITLAFLPQFVAYGKLVSLESPQTLFLTGALYFFLKTITRRVKPIPPVGWNRALLFVFSALAFATRYSSGLVFGWMGLVLLVKAFRTKRRTDLAKAFFLPLSLLIFSFAFLILIWPWLWHNPLGDFIKSFSFSGQHFRLSGLEVGYYFKYLFFTTPLVVLISAVLGAGRARGVKVVALLLWVLIFAGQGLTGLKGGGVRYALMTLPAIAVLSALGINTVLEKVRFKILALLVLVFYLVSSSLTVYPYLMDYYSESVGLAWGAHKKGLSFGFRGEGIKRTIDWLNTNAKAGSKVAIIATPDEAPPLRADFERQASPTGETDYIVALPPYLFSGGSEWELVYEEKVAGVVALAAIYKSARAQ